MSEPRPLDYHTPMELRGAEVRWHGDRVEIDIGPMPRSFFLAAMLLPAACLVVVASLIFVRSPTGLKESLILAVIGLVPCMIWLCRPGGHGRSAPRRVWASPRGVGHSDVFCPSGEQITEPDMYGRLQIRVCWFAPWAYSLVLPRRTIVTYQKTRLVALLHDGDYDRLAMIATLLEQARNPPIEQPHVRGAFEVIAKQDSEHGPGAHDG